MPEIQQINENAFTILEFLSPEECDAYIELASEQGFDGAPINGVFGPEIRSDVRNNSRAMWDDESRANELWERARDYIPLTRGEWSAVGLNERLRCYRYEVGQQFDWHFDGYFQRNQDERSHLTFMVYLNDGFGGGETSLEDFRVQPVRGMALIFKHHILHKGEPVTEGQKYVLRSDVMYHRKPAG